MELNHLRAFFEVAKVGRFTEAAQRLHISQSALSRSVALLEESGGVKLFDRSKRGVTLTPTGLEVFRYCEHLFQTVIKIEEVCRGLKSTCEGPLRFAAADHVVNYLMVKPLQKFRDEFPLVVPGITIGTPDEIIASLLNTECEFGLLFAKVPSPQIDYEPLRDESMALVVNADIWKENKGANLHATLNKVLQSVGYISSIGASLQSRPSRVLLELFGKMPRIGFEANGQEAQKRVCMGGGGIAYLQRFMVEKEIKDGDLYEIEVDSPHSFKLWLATRKGRVLTFQSQTFITRLKEKWP
jgi:DNA-binding transcriptional LysR family regulator